jgi:hypothetical protein
MAIAGPLQDPLIMLPVVPLGNHSLDSFFLFDGGGQTRETQHRSAGLSALLPLPLLSGSTVSIRWGGRGDVVALETGMMERGQAIFRALLATRSCPQRPCPSL